MLAMPGQWKHGCAYHSNAFVCVRGNTKELGLKHNGNFYGSNCEPAILKQDIMCNYNFTSYFTMIFSINFEKTKRC